MDIKKCYQIIGGDYNDVISRLLNESFVIRFVKKFLNDDSYTELQKSLENKDYETAFRAAHTLKGVCQNLSFDRLYLSSSKITEYLRADKSQPPSVLIEKLKEDYLITTEAIRELD